MSELSNSLRVVCGGRWTQDGRWVVVGPWIEGGPEVILFDPANGMKNDQDWDLAMMDLQDCMVWVRQAGSA